LICGRYYADATVIARADEGMGANRVVNADKLQGRVGLPIWRCVKIARKDLPPGSVVKLDKVTLGVFKNFSWLAGLAMSVPVGQGVVCKIVP
jgi:hypothetical protein